MEEYLILIYLIVIFFLLVIIIRYFFFNYIITVNQKGELSDDIEIYNDYYNTSTQKNNRILINNVAFLRKGIFSSIYEADLKILKVNNLNDGDEILIINNNDCNFELNLVQTLTELKKQVKIIIIKSNVLDAEKCENIINKTGFKNVNIIYLNDIQKLNQYLKEEKFDRIILRENLGIIDREKHFKILKDFLKNDNSFMYIKTLTFSPIDN